MAPEDQLGPVDWLDSKQGRGARRALDKKVQHAGIRREDEGREREELLGAARHLMR